jgi:two-component system LytT family sensor kinase
MRDKPLELQPPRRTLSVLVIGSSAYAMYRMIQTVLFGAKFVEQGVTAGQRVVVAATDGAIMALTAPLAMWASKRFPLAPSPSWRNILAHLAIAFASALAWMASLTIVFSVVTGTAFSNPFRIANLSWFTSNLFAYSLFVAIIHVVSFQERARESELHTALLQSQLSTARLETLKAQLHPHFLFNTLHTISELIHIDPKAADAMVIRLGRLLRLSLEYTGEAEVSLEREVEVLTVYLDLHRMRHDRLEATIDIDPSLHGALVPPMIFQPLVENSLRHGINRRSTSGSISIVAERIGERLRLAVRDDGIGLPEHLVEGVGLTNTRTRLAQLYDREESFVLRPRGGGGTEAIVEFPLRFQSPRLDASKVRPVSAAGHKRKGSRTM